MRKGATRDYGAEKLQGFSPALITYKLVKKRLNSMQQNNIIDTVSHIYTRRLLNYRLFIIGRIKLYTNLLF